MLKFKCYLQGNKKNHKRMKFNILVFILSIFTTYHYNAQSTKFFEIEKLGWSINLPNDFSNMEQTKKEVQIVEAKNKIEIDKNKEKTEKPIEVKFQGKNYTFFMVFYEKNKSTDKVIQIETVNKNNEQLIESLKKNKIRSKIRKTDFRRKNRWNKILQNLYKNGFGE